MAESDMETVFNECTKNLSIIEANVNNFKQLVNENHKLTQEIYKMTQMTQRMADANENNSNRLLITIGKLTHEAGERLRMQPTKQEPAISEQCKLKEEEINRLSALNSNVSEINYFQWIQSNGFF